MRPLTPRAGRAQARTGFSLVELLIALVLVGIIGTAVTTVLVKQQRFYRTAGDLLEARSQIRQATSALPNDLRAISALNGDILDMTTSSIDFDATIGSGIICQVGAVAGGAQNVYLLPRTATSARYTGWASTPQPGDRVALYNEPTDLFSAALPLAEIATGQVVADALPAAACTNSSLLTAADNQLSRHQLRITVGAGAAATVGMPIRILRRVHYSLWQSPDDQEWYLGYQDFPAGVASGVQPISGPYRPLAADTTSGLSLAYFDAVGTALPLTAAARAQVARIDVVVRALTAGGAPGNGSVRADQKLADFDRFVVGMRN